MRRTEHTIDTRALRQRSDLSQQAFADLLGVSLSTVCKWENRGSQPSTGLLPTMASKLGMTIEQLYVQQQQQQQPENRETDK